MHQARHTEWSAIEFINLFQDEVEKVTSPKKLLISDLRLRGWIEMQALSTDTLFALRTAPYVCPRLTSAYSLHRRRIDATTTHSRHIHVSWCTSYFVEKYFLVSQGSVREVRISVLRTSERTYFSSPCAAQIDGLPPGDLEPASTTVLDYNQDSTNLSSSSCSIGRVMAPKVLGRHTLTPYRWFARPMVGWKTILIEDSPLQKESPSYNAQSKSLFVRLILVGPKVTTGPLSERVAPMWSINDV